MEMDIFQMSNKKRKYIKPLTEVFDLRLPAGFLAGHSNDWADARQATFDDEEEEDDENESFFSSWID